MLARLTSKPDLIQRAQHSQASAQRWAGKRGMMSKYYDKSRIEDLVQTNRHRNAVGGMWGEMGALQLEALTSLGLTPTHSVLDVGCGSLRLGRKLVRFLDEGQYYGTDLNTSLLEAGYEKELDAFLQARLPRENLRQHDVTETVPFDRTFDYLVAFSLFTHLTEAQSTAALQSISRCMHEASCLMATYFVTEQDPQQPHVHGSGITTYFDQDPFHVTTGTLEEMASAAGLVANPVDQIVHPRGQKLFAFRSS